MDRKTDGQTSGMLHIERETTSFGTDATLPIPEVESNLGDIFFCSFV